MALGAALVANKAVARAKAVEEVAIAKLAKLAAASTVAEGDAGANVEAMAVAAEGPETDLLELPEVPPVLQAADVGQSGIGLSPEEVAAARTRELAMQVGPFSGAIWWGDGAMGRMLDLIACCLSLSCCFSLLATIYLSFL